MRDLARFRARATLIRVLHLNRSSVTSMDGLGWQRLIQQAGDPILPSLHTLTLPVMPPYPIESLFHISPSVRDLTLLFPRWDVGGFIDNIQALFNGVFARAPLLTQLRLESESMSHRKLSDELFQPWASHPEFDDDLWMFNMPNDPGSSIAFSNALAPIGILQHLEVFHMAAMNTGVASVNLLCALATLPRLHDVAFSMEIPEGVLLNVQPGFNHLTSLMVSNISEVGELAVFDSPQLRNLSIYHGAYPDPNMCLETLQLVGQRFVQLRRLSWTAHLPQHSITNAGDDFFVSLFRPLRTLGALGTLILDVGRVVVRDADIAALVAGLPHLLHFQFKMQKEHGQPPPLSANALVAIAHSCPALRSLDIAGVYIPEAGLAELEAYEPVLQLQHQLRSLYIEDLECKSESFCGMIIDMTFPGLDMKECRKRYGEKNFPSRPWGAVLERLEMFHLEREG
ncbi:hypothetical protein C8Q76DRAFT_709583 [Earliella scabrosa]|nr:hypothetical protein C8Q76DRAFT_709583 [Earliella scabrosa]